MRSFVALSSLAFTFACSEPLPPGEPTGVIDLSRDFGPSGVAGVAVESGRRLVLHPTLGVYEITAGGSATPVMESMPDPGVEVRLPFTDMVSLGDSKLALTAIGDGFILDLAAGTLELHFCYEPGFVEPWPEEREQRTDAVTFDPDSGRIIAQPRTFEVDSGEVTGSQIGYYDRDSGVDLQWYDVPTRLRSGGMAMLPEVGLVLSDGTDLRVFDGGLRDFDRLERFGVNSIDGLAHDPATGTLLVLDGDRRQLVEIAVTDLGLGNEM